jgi:hypothetical protein
MQKSLFAFCLLLSSAIWCSAQTYPNIDQQTNVDDGTFGWGSCSSCAGGQNSTDEFSTSLQSSPSLDGQSRQFFVFATLPYTDALWWYKLGPNDAVTRFNLDFWFQVDTQDLQALEFDTFHFVNGLRYMFGEQCNYRTGTWQVWNEAAKRWFDTKLSCQPFTENSWHHIVVSYHQNQSKIFYDTLSVDGATAKLSRNAFAGPLPAGWGNNLGVQFQLDLGPSGGQATMWVDNVTLTAR